jgi:hypothetical protein
MGSAGVRHISDPLHQGAQRCRGVVAQGLTRDYVDSPGFPEGAFWTPPGHPLPQLLPSNKMRHQRLDAATK